MFSVALVAKTILKSANITNTKVININIILKFFNIFKKY